MLSRTLLEQALYVVDPWYVDKIEFDSEKKRLDVHIDFRRGATFKSLNPEYKGEYKAYSTVKKEWRHLNFFEHECYLQCRTPNIKLDDNKFELVNPPWSGLSSGFTLLFEALLMELCLNMPVHAVARITNLTDNVIWRLLNKYVERAREGEDFQEVEAIGIDETSRKKHHDYISLFVDLKEKKTIFVGEGKSSETITEFSKDFKRHRGDIAKVKDISCDMSPAFIKGVKENFPEAEITFDKFHILKLINEAVDKVRKEEVASQILLKGMKYVFLKNRSNLNQKEQFLLNELSMSKLNLKTIKALHIRENFQKIYEASSLEEFILALKKWYFWASHSRIEPIKNVAKTIKKHWQGIVEWHRSKINNGILEGLNSVIQAAKSKARGYKTNFTTIAYLMTGKLDFNKFNPNCQKI